MVRRLAAMTPRARAWFLGEVAYLAERNPEAARKFVARIRAARETLAQYPRSGQIGEIPGTRIVVVTPYILTIRRRGGEIEIAAIRHAKQADARAPDDAAAGDDEA
jgi:plasmid stabilization system protein ParE